MQKKKFVHERWCKSVRSHMLFIQQPSQQWRTENPSQEMSLWGGCMRCENPPQLSEDCLKHLRSSSWQAQEGASGNWTEQRGCHTSIEKKRGPYGSEILQSIKARSKGERSCQPSSLQPRKAHAWITTKTTSCLALFYCHPRHFSSILRWGVQIRTAFFTS